MHHRGAVADRPGWVCTTPSRSMLRRVTPNRSGSGLYPNVPYCRPVVSADVADGVGYPFGGGPVRFLATD